MALCGGTGLRLRLSGLRDSSGRATAVVWATATCARVGDRLPEWAAICREGNSICREGHCSDANGNPDGDTSATSPPANDDNDADSPLRPTPPPANDDDNIGSPLRPVLYCLDHDRRVVVPIEFTVADDANLCVAIGRKHAKYDPWLLRNPCASIARLVPGASDPHSWSFDPLVVVAIGVWGTVPHSTIAALTALGLSVAAANAALGAALESIAHDNMLISRLRHSSPTRWRGA